MKTPLIRDKAQMKRAENNCDTWVMPKYTASLRALSPVFGGGTVWKFDFGLSLLYHSPPENLTGAVLSSI